MFEQSLMIIHHGDTEATEEFQNGKFKMLGSRNPDGALRTPKR